jgi:hypothetical protein
MIGVSSSRKVDFFVYWYVKNHTQFATTLTQPTVTSGITQTNNGKLKQYRISKLASKVETASNECVDPIQEYLNAMLTLQNAFDNAVQ